MPGYMYVKLIEIDITYIEDLYYYFYCQQTHFQHVIVGIVICTYMLLYYIMYDIVHVLQTEHV